MTELDPTQASIVADELAILQKVANHLYELAQQDQVPAKTDAAGSSYGEQMVSLRDQVGEARLEDVPALVAQMLQIASLMEGSRPKANVALDANSPYFGHLKLSEKGKQRDVLVGKQSMVSKGAGVAIVDWRNAPISRLYYCYHEGDEYEEEIAGRLMTGTVDARRSVSIAKGELKGIRCPQGTLTIHDHHWHAHENSEGPELKGGAGVAARPPVAGKKDARLGTAHGSFRADKHLAEITALIDPTQFDAMTQKDAGVVVLQGGAGSGKTTILLHRIAYLAFSNPQNFRPERMLVIVFSEALAAYVQQVLPSLDLYGVKVLDYRDWVKHTLKEVVRLEGRRQLDDAPSDVSALKKNPGMLRAIANQVERRKAEFADALAQTLADRDGASEVERIWVESIAEFPIAKALESFTKALSLSPLSLDVIERAQKLARRFLDRVSNLLAEWEELITDTDLLSETLQGDEALSQSELKTALSWTQKQIEDPDTYADIDDDRKATADNRPIDDDDPIFALDPHDPPLLLNMAFARFGEIKNLSGRALYYDHIAIDEAQDLSAVEIKPLHSALQENHSMTLAGDITQKVVFDNGFDNWSTLLADIGAPGIELEPFRISYRSSMEITAFSQQVLGPLAPATPPKAVRQGAPVEIFSFDEMGEEIAFLAENLRNLMAHEHEANVAVLTRYPERADFYYKMLKNADVPFLRRAQKSTFSFKPGIDVTHVAETKGLEYDYVVLVEVNKGMYPDQLEARHLLHIGATRAAYQLWVTTSSKSRSPILPSS